MLLSRISALEATGIVFTIITGVVLALFAFAAAFIQRARYIRELYRRIDFVTDSLTWGGELTPDRKGWKWVAIEVLLVNQHPEPIAVRARDEGLQVIFLEGDTSKDDLRISFFPFGDYPNIVAAGGTREMKLFIHGESLRPGRFAVHQDLEVSAMPDDLSRILLPRSKGFRWVPRPVHIRISLVDGNAYPSIESHSLTFVAIGKERENYT